MLLPLIGSIDFLPEENLLIDKILQTPHGIILLTDQQDVESQHSHIPYQGTRIKKTVTLFYGRRPS